MEEQAPAEAAAGSDPAHPDVQLELPGSPAAANQGETDPSGPVDLPRSPAPASPRTTPGDS
jgi:hypothetical protein